MTYSSTFGQLLPRSQVAQQVINTLQTPPPDGGEPLIVYYLAEVERQQGLVPRTIPVPPDTASYHGGLDFETWKGDDAPVLIVVAQPTGDAERVEAGVYHQMYEIQVAALIEADDEPTATQIADLYGAAVEGLLLQNGGFGTRVDAEGDTVPFAENTKLVTAAKTEFLGEFEQRRFVRSVVTVHSLIEHVVAEGAPTFGPDPYAAPAPWPTITTVDVQLESESAAGAFSPASGVNVVTSVGAGEVLVNE